MPAIDGMMQLQFGVAQPIDEILVDEQFAARSDVAHVIGEGRRGESNQHRQTSRDKSDSLHALVNLRE
jgi:hypothetical protein